MNYMMAELRAISAFRVAIGLSTDDALRQYLRQRLPS